MEINEAIDAIKDYPIDWVFEKLKQMAARFPKGCSFQTTTNEKIILALYVIYFYLIDSPLAFTNCVNEYVCVSVVFVDPRVRVGFKK